MFEDSCPPRASFYLSTVDELRSLAAETVRAERFWDEYGALHEIDPTRALCIGDFGLGSDSVIVLDYRTLPADPTVLYLRWMLGPNKEKRTTWASCASSFERFLELLGLG